MSEKLKASSFHEKLMPFFSFECLPCKHALKDIVDRLKAAHKKVRLTGGFGIDPRLDVVALRVLVASGRGILSSSHPQIPPSQ